MPAFPVTANTSRSLLKKVGRTANIWGWSYIVTILGAFGAGYVQPGSLRVLLLNFGILCFIIGVLELVWRWQLLKTGEARWAKVLALNQIGGTLVLLWSLRLLYVVPESILLDYSRHSEMWIQAQPMLVSMNGGQPMSDAYVLQMLHISKGICVYFFGGLLLLSQIWVVIHYFKAARQIERTPPPLAVPPVLR